MDTVSTWRARPLLGTFVEIRSSGATSVATERAIDAAFAAIARVHDLMSFHEADSDVSRLNRNACAGPVSVDPWTHQVLETALDLHQRSAGAFDIAVAPTLQRLGLLPGHPAVAEGAPAEAATSDAIELLPRHHVRFHHPALKIDLGGIAKGFAVDRAIDVLRGFDQSGGLVNAGGDLAAFGPSQEAVQVRHPRFPDRVLCQLAIGDAALASSGYSFNPLDADACVATTVVNPLTRKFASNIVGATVRAPSCIIADALTKVVMIAGERATALLKDCQVTALLVLATGEIRVTPDWQDGIRTPA
jgi:FAD:protein FMN transferase